MIELFECVANIRGTSVDPFLDHPLLNIARFPKKGNDCIPPAFERTLCTKEQRRSHYPATCAGRRLIHDAASAQEKKTNRQMAREVSLHWLNLEAFQLNSSEQRFACKAEAGPIHD